MIEQKLIDKILTASEVEHYMFIEQCGDFIFEINRNIEKGHVSDVSEITSLTESVREVREIQQFVVNQLGKFGVDPKSAIGGDRKDSSYWKWFKHWHHWHKEVLTDEEWEIVSDKMSDDEDISEYLPKEKWNEKN